jgi:Fic family protein
MNEEKINRLWEPVTFNPKWKECTTSIIDDIAPSWFARREVLQNNSQEYHEFIERLKREHAIETGVIERLYDLEKGITETFIKKGFAEIYMSENDTNVPTPKLLNHLTDHLDAVDFIFDIVNENRQLTVSFIKELQALVTRSQDFAEGRDQFGNKTKIELLKGKFKLRENNPTRADGVKIYYCPPEQVESEMDSLVTLYNAALKDKIHPFIAASWFHHAFTTIHPFQDGNGRVARLMTSLMLIKEGFFPLTVLREEAKEKYIEGLEAADRGIFQPLVDYFMEVEKRNIEKALNIKEVSGSSFEEVANIFTNKLELRQQRRAKEREKLLDENRLKVYNFCHKYFSEMEIHLKPKLNGNAFIVIDGNAPSEKLRQHFYYGQIIKYAKQHNYYFNRTLPKGWLMFKINIGKERAYQLGITIHHVGYDVNSIAIGAFLEYLEGANERDRIDSTLPLDIKPYIISIGTKLNDSKEYDIRAFLENALTLTLAHIASEI